MSDTATCTEQMSGNIRTVASAVEQMTASIGEVAKNAEQAARVADRANSFAQDGNDKIGQFGEAANEIGEANRSGSRQDASVGRGPVEDVRGARIAGGSVQGVIGPARL